MVVEGGVVGVVVTVGVAGIDSAGEPLFVLVAMVADYAIGAPSEDRVDLDD